MRLHFGPIPESPDFHPEATGWTSLREPGVGVFVWLASAVGIVAAAPIIGLWMATLKNGVVIGVSDGGELPKVLGVLAAVLGAVVALIVVHELLHAAVFPGWWLSRQTLLGVWLTAGVCYAHYEAPQSRNRFLLVLLMPFLVITLGLWGVQWLFPESWRGVLAAFSILNALFAGGDLLGAAMIGWQIPAAAEVRNQGWKTWWRLPAASAAL